MLDSYHPSTILKMKRLKKETDAAHHLAGTSAQATKKELSKVPKVAMDAKLYLEGLLDLTDQIVKLIDEMAVLAGSCFGVGDEEPDLKGLNKQFQEKKKALDALARDKKFLGGDAPFSGKYAHKPMLVPYDDVNPPFEIKLDACHCKGLLLDQLRIDSTSYAKKVKIDLERAKDLVKVIPPQISPKLEIVAGKVSALAITDSVAKGGVNPLRDDYIDIKISQERAARAKGRTRGLLLNVKA